MKTAWMKMALFSVLLSAGVFFSIPVALAQENTPVEIHFFGRDDCRFCLAEKDFLDELTARRSGITLTYHDITENAGDRDLFYRLTEAKGLPKVTPVTLVGNTLFQGFDSPQTTGVRIEAAVDAAAQQPPISVEDFIASEGGTVNGSDSTCGDDGSETCGIDSGGRFVFDLPLVGVVDLQSFSLFTLSALLGFVDGFNPCAIWVLATFLMILIQLGDRKKMLYVAGLFIFAEMVMYNLILNVWYTTWDFIRLDNIVTPLIGLLALGSGVFFLWRWWRGRNKPQTCDISSFEQQQGIEGKIRAIAASPLSLISALGIIGIAFSVNIIEFACSVGIPQAYTKILELNMLDFLSRQFYILVYTLFYMLDDVILFGLALWGFNKLQANYRYARYSLIVGGILMLILGTIMLVAPNLLVL
jgi:hypothetical protein